MTRLLTFLCLLALTNSFGQSNKTFKDTIFEVGDIVQTPEFRYYLDGDGHENDSTLQQVANFINTHGDIVFEIGSHTDSRGRSTENLLLTASRAENIKQALVTRFSVDSSRLRTKGYGNSMPINTADEIAQVKTKEEKENFHSSNRRTELKVIEIKKIRFNSR